jgi:peptidoglycan/LPS O-acetylase OafA/YrhL
MKTSERRYDIDWLRVIAIGLLLVYHISIGFQPWGVLIGFIQNNEPLKDLWIPMSILNIWRIPLLFFVSGMGVGFAIRKRNWKQLLAERARRILLPFLFGILLITPVHFLIWQKYYHQDIAYYPHQGHLWFLGNIFIYVILLMPVFIYLNGNKKAVFNRFLEKLYRHPVGLLPVTVVFILEAVLVSPDPYELYALTIHGFLLGFLAFFLGFSFIISGEIFSRTASSWRLLYLVIALLLFLVRYFLFGLKAPGYLMAVESNAWTFALFGFAYRYMNRPGHILKYLSHAAYPVYIIHMIFLYLGSYLIMPTGVPAILKYFLIVMFTGSGCFLFYEFIIRRIGFLSPVFGLNPAPQLRDVNKIQVEHQEV